ncbi:MAG: hypothetical protein V3T72_09130 [Thermoanaerobaculia bacterium]
MSGKTPPWSEAYDDWAVEETITALTPADTERLESAAETWIEVFGLDGVGRDHEDLLSEAIARTLAGVRSWRRGVDFLHHLDQTMRSIASSWRKSIARREAAGGRKVRAAELPRRHRRSLFPGAHRFSDTLEQIPSAEPDAETRLLAAESVERFAGHFAGDPAVSAVLAGWFEGLKGPEVQVRSGMTKKQFVAAVLRIRRFAQREDTEYVH